MKTARLLIAMFVLVASLGILSGSASAQAPTGTWVSGISCVNTSTSADANITLSFYAENNAALAYSYPDTILAGQSKNYFTPTNPPGIPTNFFGSVVISSSVEIVCNVNTQSTGTGTVSSPLRIGASGGVSAGSQRLYFPQLEKTLAGTWNSYMAIQNAGSTDANVTITYVDRFGVSLPAATETYVIPPNASKVVYQGANANLPAGFLGSAVVDGGTGASLVGMAAMYNNASNNTTAQFMSYNGFATGAQKLLFPRVLRNYYAFNSGITIQNVGSIPTQIQIDYYLVNGNKYTYISPTPIAQGYIVALYLPNVAEFNGVDSQIVGYRYGYAEVTALATGAQIVGIVNEDNRGGTGVPVERVGQGATYGGATAGTQTVYFPQMPKNVGNISGGFIVANTTTNPGTCNFTFTGSDATLTAVPIAGNGSLSYYMPNVVPTSGSIPNGYNSAVVANCTVPVVGLGNFSANPGSGLRGDSFIQTNGLNK